LGLPDGPLTPHGQIPNYSFPEPPARALGAAWRLAQWRRHPHVEPPVPEGFDEAAVRAVVERLLTGGPGERAVGGDDLADLLTAAGIPLVATRRVTSCEDAVAAAGDLGYPVVLRAVDPPLRGRSEAGGIALDLQDGAALRGAYDRIDARAGGLRAAVVQRMAPPGVEARLTLASHEYGPQVSFGLGGLYADLIHDGAPVALPLDERSAAEAVADSRAGAALALSDVPSGMSTDLLLRVSLLADTAWELVHLDLNPVLIGTGGAWVLDGTARLAPVSTAPLGGVRAL
jgi:acyl-CoA synthetase (NDP forming)